MRVPKRGSTDEPLPTRPHSAPPRHLCRARPFLPRAGAHGGWRPSVIPQDKQRSKFWIHFFLYSITQLEEEFKYKKIVLHDTIILIQLQILTMVSLYSI